MVRRLLPMDAKRRRKILRFVLLGVLLSIVFSVLLYVWKFTPHWFLEQFPQYSWWAAPLAYMGWEFIATLIPPIPNPISAVFGGYFFGTFPALIYTLVASIAGSISLFLLGRYGKETFAMRFLKRGKALRKVDLFLSREHGFYSLIFIRFSPIFPNDVLSLFLGFTTITFRRFVITTLLGYSVPFLVLAHMGSLLAGAGGDISQARVVPMFVLLTLLSVIGLVVAIIKAPRRNRE